MTQKHICSLLVVALLSGSFAKAPKWALTGKHKAYPAELYFVAVGISQKDLETAKQQAVSGIAGQISVGVKASMVDVQSEETFGGKAVSSYEKAESRTRLSVSGEIQGVSVTETGKHKKTHYALAVLDKKKFASVQKAKIAELRKSILATLENAKVSSRSGKVLQALKGIKEIRIASNQILEERKLLSAAEPITDAQSVPVTKQDLNAIMEQCVSALRFEKVSGDGQVFPVGQTLAEPLVVRLTIQEGANAVPVPGVSLRVKDEDGKAVAEGITLADGQAEIFLAEQASGMGPGKHSFVVDVRLSVSATLKKQLKAIAQTFKFEVLSNPAFTTLSLKLPGKLKKSEADAQKKMWKVLKKVDIQEDKSAPSVLEITFKVEEKGTVQGLSASQTFVEVSTSAHCVLKSSGKEAASFDLKPKKGMGSSLKKAFLKSLGNLKFKKELAPLMDKIRGAKATPRPKLAIFPLKNASGSANWFELSQSLTGMMVTSLINAGKFDVVERDRIATIMEEKKLGMTGLSDLSMEMQVAQLASADYLIVGSVSQQEVKIEADVRLVKASDGKALKAANGSVTSRSRLRQLANQLVKELVKAGI